MTRLLAFGLLLTWAGTAGAQAPGTHRAPDFLQTHGGTVEAQRTTCAVCHAQESCYQCHRGNPEVADGLPTAASGSSMNVTVNRRRPASHTPAFESGHGSMAASRPEACAGCHIRSDCLECHRPNPAAAGGYHDPGFLTAHPQQAYQREASCSTCHNPAQFCQSCHVQSGITSDGKINRGYHDKVANFLGGHGQAARQNLESCVSCHTQSDCLACHQQFKPHGPGFNAESMAKRASQMCRTCHVGSIPQTSRQRP